jgi:DNA polymerase-3 subunit delta
MILFVYGKDTFRSREYVRKMIEKFKNDRDPQGLNVSIFDATKDAGPRILEEIRTFPFLAEKRLVVIENILQAKQQVDLQKTLLKQIEEQTIPSTTVILIWDSGETIKEKIAKELFARLQVEKYAQEFTLLDGPKLEAWIAAEIQDRGGNMSHEAIHFLVMHVGSDMWRLHTVIDQMLAYKNGQEIAVKDLEQSVEMAVDENIFSLIDAIVQKKSAKIFALLEEQYRTGNDVGYIFAMLVRQFRIMLEMKDLLDRGGSSDFAKELGLHPFVAKKTLPLVQSYSLDELTWVYEELLNMDIATKTGGGDQKVLLDLFIGRLCCA